METMAWKDEYCVGIEETDRQHMDFVRLINRLIILFGSRASSGIQNRILLEIRKYAEYHFVSEENLMLLYQYPAKSTQEEAHQRLLETLNQQCAQLREGSLSGSDIVNYLIAWFLQHTQEEDRKFAQFLNEKAKQRTATKLEET